MWVLPASTTIYATWALDPAVPALPVADLEVGPLGHMDIHVHRQFTYDHR